MSKEEVQRTITGSTKVPLAAAILSTIAIAGWLITWTGADRNEKAKMSNDISLLQQNNVTQEEKILRNTGEIQRNTTDANNLKVEIGKIFTSLSNIESALGIKKN